MKTKLGVLIFVFLTAMILGTAQPALLYAGPETPGGNLWDPFVDTSEPSPTDIKLDGALSIYYEVTCKPQITKNKPVCYPCCPCDLGTATMFYTVRLSKEFIVYTYEGSTPGVCLGNIGGPGEGGQGDVIMSFLGTVVTNIFGSGHTWKLKSVNNPGIAPDSLAFGADITIAVQ